MRALNIFLLAVCFSCVSCEFGVKQDMATGLKVVNKDLSYSEANIYADNKKLKSGEVEMNSVIDLRYTGIKGFTASEGSVFPGASITITDMTNHEVIHFRDLFEDYDEKGVSSIDAGFITLTLTIAEPLVTGEKYIFSTRVWDKKGKGEITSEMELHIK